MRISLIILALVLAGSGLDAHAAKRLGGGSSIGKQSSNVSQRQAAPTPPAAPGAPTQNAVPSGAKSPTPATPSVAPKRPWGAMLGGLAAGLGLAWLANSLGMGEAFGQFMLFALLALVVMAAVGWFLRSRRSEASSTGTRPGTPFAFQGAGPGGPRVPTARGGSTRRRAHREGLGR